jgi:hypothetical protein
MSTHHDVDGDEDPEDELGQTADDTADRSRNARSRVRDQGLYRRLDRVQCGLVYARRSELLADRVKCGLQVVLDHGHLVDQAVKDDQGDEDAQGDEEHEHEQGTQPARQVMLVEPVHHGQEGAPEEDREERRQHDQLDRRRHGKEREQHEERADGDPAPDTDVPGPLRCRERARLASRVRDLCESRLGRTFVRAAHAPGVPTSSSGMRASAHHSGGVVAIGV